MTRTREESGFALVTSVIIIFVLLGLGIALLKFTDTQQKSSTFSQSRESAYSLAEAALNAQIFQLSLGWPTSANGPHPTVCTPSTGSTAGCPDPNGLTTAYPNTGTGSCPSGTPSDPWGQPLSTQWATYVRADGGGTSKLFSSSVDQAQPAYDAGGVGGLPDGTVWVRAVGVANCRAVSVVSKVAVQYIPLNFPQLAVTANAFATGNQGNKLIIDTKGTANQLGPIDVRCNGVADGPPLQGSPCASFRTGQVNPDTTTLVTGGSPSTLTSYQIQSLRVQAQNNGTYWGVVNGVPQCPTSLSQLSGQPTFIEGHCDLNFSDNNVANSASNPGFLVINDGTLTLGGTTTFYGVIYCVNAQNSSGVVVSLTGNTTVVGAIDVDGNGQVQFGDSHINFTYSTNEFSSMKSFGGAITSPNTFRVLPDGQ